MDSAQIISLAVFAGVMVLIASEKIHRALAAIIGLVVVLFTGVIGFEEAFRAIDWNTLGLLLAMMVIVSVSKTSGIFEFTAVKTARLAKGKPWIIMLYFSIITALLSALLDNVTTILLICPMALSICKKLDINPVPFLMTQVLISNIGGTATLVGDPPNLLIGSAAKISYFEFLLYNGPIIVIILALTMLAFYFMYAKKLQSTPEKMNSIMAMDEKSLIVDKPLFIISIVLIVLSTIAFCIQEFLHVETSVIALCAAAVILLIKRSNLKQTIKDIEWPTLVFFIGLFVVVGAMSCTGIISMLANAIIDISGNNSVLLMLLILWVSAILSAIIDNIPFIAASIPIILSIQSSGIDVFPLWWALSLGACLGGNGTIIGASANVVVVDLSKKEGYPLSFFKFLKTGGPIMLLSIIASTIYLLIRF